jgi:hypothetical protein
MNSPPPQITMLREYLPGSVFPSRLRDHVGHKCYFVGHYFWKIHSVPSHFFSLLLLIIMVYVLISNHSSYVCEK